jgi:hypothetical protein
MSGAQAHRELFSDKQPVHAKGGGREATGRSLGRLGGGHKADTSYGAQQQRSQSPKPWSGHFTSGQSTFSP